MKLALDRALTRPLLLGVLVAALQVPSCMIGRLGDARSASRDEAAAEIASHWGGSQALSGPFLVVPFTVEERAADGKPYQRGGFLTLSPTMLDAEVTATVETRNRGLFQMPVYRASARMRGYFAKPATVVAGMEPDASFNWDQAELVMRLSDVHAIDATAAFTLQDRQRSFDPGGGALASGGLHAMLPGLNGSADAAFDFSVDFRGSGDLQLAPGGLDTDVTLKSNWPAPKFEGAWLPVQREIGADGFTARWHVPYVARGLPAAWQAGNPFSAELDKSLFGAGFVAPVDAYRMAERSLKYSTLFVGLAFLLVWLFEVVGGARVHPVQYLLLGASLTLFYLLELSLAEQLGFGVAYALAAGAVTAQVTLYSRAALAGRRPLVMCGATGLLYGLLYLLLREDDYALLVGSISLFLMLSVVMFLTRNVRWESLNPETPAVPS